MAAETVRAGRGRSGRSPEDAPHPQTHAWIKAAVAVALLLLVALAVVMPMDKELGPGQGPPDRGALLATAHKMTPNPRDMVQYARLLYYCLPTKDAVIDQLRNDPNLTPEQRREALEIAKDVDDSAELLNDSAWFVVRYSKGTPKSYQRLNWPRKL